MRHHSRPWGAQIPSRSGISDLQGDRVCAPYAVGLEVGYALRVLGDSLLSGEQPGCTFTGVRSRA
jgi:hypothetical protein